jgi:hypothetical protein
VVLVDDAAEDVSSPDRTDRRHLGSGLGRIEAEAEVGALSVVVDYMAA